MHAPTVSRSCSRALARLFFEITGGTAKPAKPYSTYLFICQISTHNTTQHMEFGLALLASKIETVTTHKVEQANTRRQTPAPPL
jgi:hypothetical protein